MLVRFFSVCFLTLLVSIPTVTFAYGTGHHGGMILDCTAPEFFEESPSKDAKVAVLDTFSFTASDNTDPATLKVWVNTQPITDIQITPQRSGRLSVNARLPEPVSKGRAWIKVTAVSQDGCDQLHNWYVYTGQ